MTNFKRKFAALLAVTAVSAFSLLGGCSFTQGSNDGGFAAPDGYGDMGGGFGGNGANNSNNSNNTTVSTNADTAALVESAEKAISEAGAESVTGEIPEGATEIAGKITIGSAGAYYVSTAIAGKKISIACEGVTLYLSGASLSNEKKVIESEYGLTLILIGENSITNSNSDGSNAIDCAGDLVISGGGSLTINSTKNGIKANSITVLGATLDITAAKDGLHAEVEKYDSATEAPTPAYDDGGYVYIDGGKVTVNAKDDGIQADTFVYISGESEVNVTSTGKGIKSGGIDWGVSGIDLSDWADYLIYIKSGKFVVNATDDALHSNGSLVIEGGTFTISSGDDGVHADDALVIGGGSIDITKSYEGLEGTTIDINGGEITLVASDDGINAAGGTDSSGFGGMDNGGWGFGFGMGGRGGNMGGNMGGSTSTSSEVYIRITGGVINVNASGDGVDSNGNLYVTGGELYVSGPTSSADGALDYDGTAQITGGIVVAAGASGMAQNFGNTSTQGSVMMTVSSGSGEIKLSDSDGTVLVSFTPAKSYSSVVVSCPSLTVGNKYTLTTGSKSSTFTLNSLIYGGSMGGGGNGMGGRF